MNEQKPRPTLRKMGDLLAAAYKLPAPDPATINRALKKLAVRS
jgi:hypothetical protein